MQLPLFAIADAVQEIKPPSTFFAISLPNPSVTPSSTPTLPAHLFVFSSICTTIAMCLEINKTSIALILLESIASTNHSRCNSPSNISPQIVPPGLLKPSSIRTLLAHFTLYSFRLHHRHSNVPEIQQSFRCIDQSGIHRHRLLNSEAQFPSFW